ncbi:lipoyl(octanoyl) transferase LipB [Mucisphaera sp.]|uniref:lipoyl(octanoyl) transferase LipB n=1 Tax=Mucisphaera sp. TaxID=2913024 RepID=UPI003D11672A
MVIEAQSERLLVERLGLVGYREAMVFQARAHAEVLEGGRERLLLVEHPSTVTLPDRPGLLEHVLASDVQRKRLGVSLEVTDRGGDVTYHGPGQLVVYPIVRLRDHGLNLGRYMRLLETVVIDVLAGFGVAGFRREGATGVWVGEADRPKKVCAMGVRIRKHVTMHGLALNVATDLSRFELIVPCGLAEREVTSLRALLGVACPSMAEVEQALVSAFAGSLERGGASGHG